MNGAINFEKPRGKPALRSVIRVERSSIATHSYVVSMGKGPYAVRIVSLRPGTISSTS